MVSPSVRRVAIICPADDYVGPALIATMAQRNYDLVIGGKLPSGVETGSVNVVRIDDADPHDLTTGTRLVEAAKSEFGTFHSAFFSSGRIALGRFSKTNVDDLRSAFEGNVVAPYAYVQAVLPTLVEQADGQIVVATSATADTPTPSASLYAGTRAAATMMLRSVAKEVMDRNVQINVVGTNFMDFPGFLRGNKAESAEGRVRVESLVPMKRLGSMQEFANFCAVFLDGTSRFQSGQFHSYAGGWGI